MDKLISVIVPCYNQAEFLDESIQSLIAQTYHNWECIIVNDGSEDNAEDIVLQWCKRDQRIKYVRKCNGGLSSARNAGLRIAKGDFIQFLDADDAIEKNKFEKQILEFIRNNKIDVVYSSVRYFESCSNILYYSINKDFNDWQPKLNNNHGEIFEFFLQGNIMACNCPLIKRTIINKVGFFNESLKSHEDYEYWIRIALAGGFFWYTDESNSFALVRIHNKSMSNDKKKMSISALFVKYFLVKELIKRKAVVSTNLYFQYRSIKKEITKLYLSGNISKKEYFKFLNLFEKAKFFPISLVPNRIRYLYMTFDYFDFVTILKNRKSINFCIYVF